MKYYGVRHRAYPTVSADLYHGRISQTVLDEQVRECLSIKDFLECATHGENGEYGHKVHCMVHQAVKRNSQCKMLATVPKYEIEKYKLNECLVDEKKKIFRELYTTEAWCINQYAVWIEHEKLQEIKKDEDSVI